MLFLRHALQRVGGASRGGLFLTRSWSPPPALFSSSSSSSSAHKTTKHNNHAKQHGKHDADDGTESRFTVSGVAGSSSPSASACPHSSPEGGSDQPQRPLLSYRSYLGIDTLLSLQNGGANGKLYAHEEHLFMVVHQAFELWFKQIIFDLGPVLQTIDRGTVTTGEALSCVAKLDRANHVLRYTLGIFDILETMHPCEFHEFRDYIGPASGFQSEQTRVIEILLGLDDKQRFMCGTAPYLESFAPDQRERLQKLQQGPNLKRSLQRLLAGIEVPPNFVSVFLEAKRRNLIHQKIYWFGEDRQKEIEKAAALEIRKTMLLLEGTDLEMEHIDRFPDVPRTCRFMKGVEPEKPAEPVTPTTVKVVLTPEEKQERIRARLGALFVQSYRHEPQYAPLSRIIEQVVALEEGLLLWRGRHVRMVERMIGRRVGTGGSSGVDYLDATMTYRIFDDLFTVCTMLMKNSDLPPLADLALPDPQRTPH